MVNSPATTSTHAAVSTEEGPTILVGVAGGATGAAWGAVAFAVALGPAVPLVAFVPFVLLPAPPTEPEPLPEPEALDEALPDPEEAFTVTVAFLAGALPAAAESLLPAGSPSIESFTGTRTRMCRRAVSSRSETWESAPCLASAVTKKASARKTARISAIPALQGHKGRRKEKLSKQREIGFGDEKCWIFMRAFISFYI